MLDFKLYSITDRWLMNDFKAFVTDAAQHGLRSLRVRDWIAKPEATIMDRVKDIRLFEDVRNAAPKTNIFISSPNSTRGDVGAVAAVLATFLRAEGIHVPEGGIYADWNPREVKQEYDLPEFLFGASVHSVEAAKYAADWGADFITFGPVFDTPSKRAMGFGPQGLQKLNEVTKAVTIPTFAIGGITPSGARTCLEEGAWGVAVVRDLILAPNLGERIAEYREVLGTL